MNSPTTPPAPTRRLVVWDPWIRLVHWAIVLLLPFSWWTAETERFDLHYLSGYAILALLIFRVAWGFVGSQTARFGAFLKSPLAALRHLGHFRRRDAAVEIGHNAAGGWMVLLLLLLLLAQAATGLFAAHDPGMTYSQHGPLSMLVSERASETATRVHVRLYWAILAAAVLHVAAVAAYRVLQGRNLVRPMLTGRLEVPAGQPAAQPRLGHPLLAIVLLAAAGTFVWWLTTLAPPSIF